MKSLNLIKKKAWLKPYIDMNTNLDKKQKIILRETFSSRWIMQFLERLLKCDKKNRNIKLVTTERRRKYHTTKYFTENVLAMEMRKTQVIMNKPGYLDLSILDLLILVWLCKTKIWWWKCRTLAYGYRHPHCSCKNKWFL